MGLGAVQPVAVRFVADENPDRRIVAGLQRHVEELDLLRVQASSELTRDGTLTFDEGFDRGGGDSDSSADVHGVEVAVSDQLVDGAATDGEQLGGFGDLHQKAGVASVSVAVVVAHVTRRPSSAPGLRERTPIISDCLLIVNERQ